MTTFSLGPQRLFFGAGRVLTENNFLKERFVKRVREQFSSVLDLRLCRCFCCMHFGRCPAFIRSRCFLLRRCHLMSEKLTSRSHSPCNFVSFLLLESSLVTSSAENPLLNLFLSFRRRILSDKIFRIKCTNFSEC